MTFIQVRDLKFSYGGENLLDGVSLTIAPGERIGLVGRNGTGKSTLLKLLAGDLQPDHGSVDLSPATTVARLTQDVPPGAEQTVFDEVVDGFSSSSREALRQHLRAQAGPPDGGAGQGGLLSSEALEMGWKLQHQAESLIERMGLSPLARFEDLSSGMKRRVLLARALVGQPAVLLLDEPTNHLDLDAIRWLQQFLLREGLTLMFVTHDRAFLQRLANRIVEVDRGRLFDWTCDYKTFLVRKEAALDAEAKQEALFDKRLAAEEVWIRTGIKARRTRNEGRVRALEQMREEQRRRRDSIGSVRMQVQESERSGQMVIEARHVTQRFGECEVLRDVTLLVDRGDKIGIIGPNGAGKTTLLRTLLGELTPGSGVVRLGSNLRIAYFDQLRAQLDEDRSAAENVTDGTDSVIINGKSRHIIGYLQDFLFSPDRARSLVKYLSGGERNRLLLARMFTKPSNLLVLDEPTNDLDAETLELLESMLVESPNTVLMVSHDREFLNNVVTSTWVFEGAGHVKAYAGGYDDMLRQQAEDAAPEPAEKAPASRPARAPTRRRTFKQQRELEELPRRIEVLEAEQADHHRQMAAPAFYQQPGAEIARVRARLDEVTAELEAAYDRWALLEAAD